MEKYDRWLFWYKDRIFAEHPCDRERAIDLLKECDRNGVTLSALLQEVEEYLKNSFDFNSKDPDVIHIQDCEFKTKNINDYENSLYVSDDIFIVGYPKGITDYTMQPIWKRATVAIEPHVGWEHQEQFLVDCASREGMSGAPAIYYNRDGKINTGNIHYKGFNPISIFHGIYVGRLGLTSELEAQIGKAWKRKVIDEIIHDKILDFLPDELMLSNSDIKQAILKQWPKDHVAYAGKLLDDKTFYKYHFLEAVMKNINGRANKDEVLEIIMQCAKTKLSEIS